MLEGLLVDLVPQGESFEESELLWMNNISTFWSSGGEYFVVSKAQFERRKARHREWDGSDNPARGVNFGVQTKDGLPIGFISINWFVPAHRLAMLGVKIGDPAYWGGGYGTDATLLLIDYAFKWLDLNKVWLMTTTFNERVQRQMARLGFTLESRIREGTVADGVWHDWLAYGMLRHEWPGREVMLDREGYRERWGV